MYIRCVWTPTFAGVTFQVGCAACHPVPVIPAEAGIQTRMNMKSHEGYLVRGR